VNSRRSFLTTATAVFLATPFTTRAQQTAKAPRVSYLAVGSPSPRTQSYFDALRQGLRELGYVEGQNVVIEDRWVNAEQLPDVAAELVRRRPDVLVAQGNAVVAALKQATQIVPIVAAAFGDPVGAGFVASLAKPGGNITGFSTSSEEMNVKWLELLKETIPRLSRVGVLWPVSEVNSHVFRKAMESAARTLAIKVSFVEVGGRDDITHAFATFSRARAGAFIASPGAATGAHRRLILDLAATNRLPGIYPWTVFVEDGGLMCYGPDLRAMLRRSAVYVDKVLKGAKPADLPVEQPTRFQLLINLRTAKALGLTVPPSLLLRADEVLQ